MTSDTTPSIYPSPQIVSEKIGSDIHGANGKQELRTKLTVWPLSRCILASYPNKQPAPLADE